MYERDASESEESAGGSSDAGLARDDSRASGEIDIAETGGSEVDGNVESAQP